MSANIEGPFKSAPDRKPGSVIVAVGAKGAIILQEGERLTWGERIWGGYNSFFLVDKSVKTVVIRFTVPSRQPTLMFEADINMDLQIIDARGAFERNLNDFSTVVTTAARGAVVKAAKQFTVRQLPEAEDAVHTALIGLPIDPAIRISNVSVVIHPDAEAMKPLRTADEEEIRSNALRAQENVDAIGRSAAKGILSSPDELLAQLLITKDDAYRAALQLRLDQASTEQQRRFEIMKALIDSKIIEPHDFHNRFPGFVDDVFRSVSTQATLAAPKAPRITDQSAVKKTVVDAE
jgi:hypothetical protein